MSRYRERIRYRLRDQDGVTLVWMTGLLVVFLGFTALAVDISHLYAVRNELQNAADAGALAGAQVLYCPPSCYPACNPKTCPSMGTGVNGLANDMAGNIAIANKSEKVVAEATWASGLTNGPDVQRGHWSFATRTFVADNSLSAVNIANYTTAELDADADADTGAQLHYINAVKVQVRRQSNPANSFFARVLGFNSFAATAQAVAYIGFSGKLNPTEADQPIAICKQSITDAFGNYTNCNIGRMLNSGHDAETHNTAAWTNFTQPCDTASASSMRSLICSTGNPLEIRYGAGIGATGGTQDTTIADLRTCFGPKTRTTPWNMTLPVIDCPGNNPSNCAPLIGAVNVNIVWISDKDADTEKKFEAEDFPPSRMGDWEPTMGTRVANWADFVDHFKLENVDGMTATYAQKSIYFLPSCAPTEPSGNTGGANYGVMAKIPVLVD